MKRAETVFPQSVDKEEVRLIWVIDKGEGVLKPKKETLLPWKQLMDLVKNGNKEWETPERQKMLLREPQLKKLAHLPLLALFYLSFQRRFSATPVTPLELAAYLGLDVAVAEALLSSSAKKGWVKGFKEGMPAYTMVKDLDQISVRDLVEWIGEIQEMVKKAGSFVMPSSLEPQEKYRKIYSELASEMLQLFGEEAVNKIPL